MCALYPPQSQESLKPLSLNLVICYRKETWVAKLSHQASQTRKPEKDSFQAAFLRPTVFFSRLHRVRRLK